MGICGGGEDAEGNLLIKNDPKLQEPKSTKKKFKVLVLGRPGWGKSSLIQTLKAGKFVKEVDPKLKKVTWGSLEIFDVEGSEAKKVF